jgi:putative ABC transport system permease protein
MVFANIRGALEQLWVHKIRSILTVLGMVIAVSSTITVVSVVHGFTAYAAQLLQGMGTNAMWVWPERPSGEAGQRLGRVEMDLDDVAEVERRCAALGGVSPVVRQLDVKVRHGRESASVALEGVSAEYHAIRKFFVRIGRPFAVIDVERAHHVCVVGSEVVRKLNADDDLVGLSILLGGQRFRVVGILEEKGSLLGKTQDDVVLVPHTIALKMFPSQRRKVAFAARAGSELQVPEARSQITNLLRRRHRLAAYQPNDFNIRTQDEVLVAFNSLSLVATAILAGIVGISLLVGGIGIMNVMLVGVTERTREIGLRKAVGARRRDILVQFLTEAVVLSLTGGMIGIAFGYALSSLASLHPQMIDVVVPGWAVGLAFSISALTGVVFGLLPAVKAALLNPIDALRSD